MTDDEAAREALADRILANACERVALMPYEGVRKNILNAAERHARRALAGELLDWKPIPPKAPPPLKSAAERLRQKALARAREVAPPEPRAVSALLAEQTVVRSRPCLCCKTPFPSRGPGNRLCGLCRGRASEMSPYQF